VGDGGELMRDLCHGGNKHLGHGFTPINTESKQV
jgi:hypothetical protein